MRRIDLKRVQAANLHTIRDINRQIVLNYVREREPISRATIARETALQRSTISEIVEALTGEGLVEEIGEGESTAVGDRRYCDCARSGLLPLASTSLPPTQLSRVVI